jgi:hypothetical protein
MQPRFLLRIALCSGRKYCSTVTGIAGLFIVFSLFAQSGQQNFDDSIDSRRWFENQRREL